MNQVPAIPDLVRRAFSLSSDTPQRVGRAWNNGWRVGSCVLSRVVDTQQAARVAALRSSLQIPGVQIARPRRASDGRYIFGGWQATQYLPGTLMRHADEHVGLALRLEHALRDVPVAAFCTSPQGSGGRKRTSVGTQSRAQSQAGQDADLSSATLRHQDLRDLFSRADAVAWSDDPRWCENTPWEEPAWDLAKECIRAAGSVRSLGLPRRLCHGDLVNSVVREGVRQPTLTDIFPLVRPAGYTAALAIVDSISAENAGLGLLHRYRHVPCIVPLCLRAAAYRLLIHSELQKWGLAKSSNIISILQKLLQASR